MQLTLLILKVVYEFCLMFAPVLAWFSLLILKEVVLLYVMKELINVKKDSNSFTFPLMVSLFTQLVLSSFSFLARVI